MSVRVNVRMSKIMHTPMKVVVRTYVTYANCQSLTGRMLLPDYFYIPSYSVSCFILKHFMTSWFLNIWFYTINKLKFGSQGQKELSKWNKKHFSSLHKCSLLELVSAIFVFPSNDSPSKTMKSVFISPK